MVRVETVLDSWKSVREDTALAVEEFPADDFDFKPAADLMSFREIATHILHASHGITGMLLAGADNLATPEFRATMMRYAESLPPHHTPAELASALRSALAKRSDELAAQSPDFHSGIITRFDGQKVTRLELIQFTKEHELSHRAQIFLYLRLKGLVPATTRRRQAKAKA